MTDDILRMPEVKRIIGMGTTWINDAVKRNEFPSPVRLGARAKGWKRSDIEHWIESRKSILDMR